MSADFLSLELVIYLLKFILKVLQNRVFFLLWRRDPVLGTAISHNVARSFTAFCNSISEDSIVMAGSKLLVAVVAAAACVMLLSFAA